MKRKKIWRGAALALALLMTATLFAACGEKLPPEPDGGDKTPPAVTPGGDDGENNNQNSNQNNGNGAEEKTFSEGWYVLSQKTVQGTDVTAEYTYNCIYFKDGVANWYEVDYSGLSEKSGDYTVEEETVSIGIGVRVYDFAIGAEMRSITYSGKINRQNVVMRYEYEKEFVLPVASSGALFTEELFGESKDENFYNYCPTVMMEGNDTMHVWYCTNKDSGIVYDYIGYRKGTLNASGKWEFTEKQIVLSPAGVSSGEWDGKHNCDPSVVKGSFAMGGETYSYLMAYLGCTTGDVNQVGIAVAKAPEGPFVKVESVNPIADYFHSSDYVDDGNYYWGYGQPSLVSVDNAGKVLLFYAKGTAKKTCTQVETWDLSDLDSPQKLNSAELREGNVVNAGGTKDCINNADFAFDPVNNRLYCIKEDFPYPTDASGINWITGSNTLMYISLGEKGFDLLFDETEIYSWNILDSLSADGTTYVRAHNAGIVTDGYGRLANPFRVPVLYTVSEAATAYPEWSLGGQWPALHTYRIHGAVFEVS